MAKAIKGYMGSDTYGRGVELVQREDGVWFCRCEEIDPVYGRKNGKWKKYTGGEPVLVNEVENKYTGEMVAVEEGKYAEWGFNLLKRINWKMNYRLPNN